MRGPRCPAGSHAPLLHSPPRRCPNALKSSSATEPRDVRPESALRDIARAVDVPGWQEKRGSRWSSVVARESCREQVIDIRSSGGLVRLQPRPTTQEPRAFRPEYTPQPPAARRPGLDGNSRRDGALTLPMGPRALVLGVVVAAVGVCVPPGGGRFRGVTGSWWSRPAVGLSWLRPGRALPNRSAPTWCCVVIRRAAGLPERSGDRVSSIRRAACSVVVALGWIVPVVSLGRAADKTGLGATRGSLPAARAVTVARGGLWRISLAGGAARRLVKGPVNGAVWSSTRSRRAGA